MPITNGGGFWGDGKIGNIVFMKNRKEIFFSLKILFLFFLFFPSRAFAQSSDWQNLVKNWPITTPDSLEIWQDTSGKIYQLITKGGKYWVRTNIESANWSSGNINQEPNNTSFPFPQSIDGMAFLYLNNSLWQTITKNDIFFTHVVGQAWRSAGKIFSGETTTCSRSLPLEGIDTLTAYPDGNKIALMVTKNGFYWKKSDINSSVWDECGQLINDPNAPQKFEGHTRFLWNGKIAELAVAGGRFWFFPDITDCQHYERGLIQNLASGRFGVAVGTWDYNQFHCYTLDGNRIPCLEDPFGMNPKGFSDNRFANYDFQQLNRIAFNISSFNTRDPNANTQFIWFHYEETDNPLEITGGNFSYLGQYQSRRLGRPMTSEEILNEAQIYAVSGAPGSVRVRLVKENSQINGVSKKWRIRLPKIVYKNGYPFCEGCIFKENEFYQFLDAHSDFDDGWGNWYALYMLAEVEYGIVSHYLEPYEYAAVLNEYVEKLKSKYPRIRFILASPVGATPKARKYFETLYNPHFKLLTEQTKAAINFTSADIFLGRVPAPDFDYNGYPAVSDSQLKGIACQFLKEAKEIGNFFYLLTGKQTLLTQTAPWIWGAVQAPPDDLGYNRAPCPWCKSNDDVWETTKYGNARLIQLAYGTLAQKTEETKVAAWAYWGNMRQARWKEPLLERWCGDLCHGFASLSLPAICDEKGGCPQITNEPKPTVEGITYLQLAWGNYNFRPEGAPSWWPTQNEDFCSLPNFPPPSTPNLNAEIKEILANFSLNNERLELYADGKINAVDFGKIIIR